MFEDENSQLCRLCLKSGDCPIDIFNPKGTNGLLVWEIIKELIGMETSHSAGSPLTICEDCMRKLTEFKYFKKMCFNSRIEFLIRQINDRFVVPIKMEEINLCEPADSILPGSCDESVKEEHSEPRDVESQVPGRVDESGPLREDLHGQGDLHARGSWSNVGAEGIKSEVTGVNCTDGVSVPVDGVGGREGYSEETLIRGRGSNRLTGTGHQRSAEKQHHAVVPGAIHSHLKRRSLRSQSKNDNYGPNDGIETTTPNTSGNPFGLKNGVHSKSKGETRRESKHGNGSLAGSISMGSSVGDEKSEGQDFICDECGKMFRSKVLIARHVKVPCGTELIDCGTCSTELHTRNECKRHRSLDCGSDVSNRIRVQGGLAVGMSRVRQGKRQIKKRIPPTCHICKKTFSHMGNLKVHIKTVHLKAKVFPCDVCGKAFGVKGALQCHMSTHSEVKHYTCSHCQRGFSESGNLRKHIRAIHEMEKPHTCDDCGMTFSYKHNLNRHMLLHTGERPHTCDICSKTFGQNGHLKRHLATHTRKVPHQ